MSHAPGQILFPDGHIMFFEYDGTSSICISHLYDQQPVMLDNWRKGERLLCNCGKDESVTFYADYGSGFTWEGRACRYCKAITDGLMPFSGGINRLKEVPGWTK
jgi:hypothetical protein